MGKLEGVWEQRYRQLRASIDLAQFTETVDDQVMYSARSSITNLVKERLANEIARFLFEQGAISITKTRLQSFGVTRFMAELFVVKDGELLRKLDRNNG